MTLLGSPRRLVSEDRLAGPAAVDSYFVRSRRDMPRRHGLVPFS